MRCDSAIHHSVVMTTYIEESDRDASSKLVDLSTRSINMSSNFSFKDSINLSDKISKISMSGFKNLDSHNKSDLEFNPNFNQSLPNDLTCHMKSFNDEHAQKMYSSENDSKKKHRTDKNKVCGVCGDRALGYNFDAISCESCKAFFRRNAPKGLESFKCANQDVTQADKCNMDIFNRRFCKRCRLKKCFSIGMRKEYILSEAEKCRKRKKIERNKVNRINKKTTLSKNKITTCPITHDVYIENSALINNVVKLSDDNIKLLTNLQKAYNASIRIPHLATLNIRNASTIADILNISEIGMRRIIEMSKRIPAFRNLTQEDQVILLKGGSLELLIIRGVMSYEREHDHFRDKNDDPVSCSMPIQVLHQIAPEIFQEYIDFVSHILNEIGADICTLLLLLMITLFNPDRPNIVNREAIEIEQIKYTMALRNYVEIMYPSSVSDSMFANFIMKLTDVKNINEKLYKAINNINIENINPLMKEVLEIEFKYSTNQYYKDESLSLKTYPEEFSELDEKYNISQNIETRDNTDMPTYCESSSNLTYPISNQPENSQMEFKYQINPQTVIMDSINANSIKYK
ncbi:1,25-dihydroxyvitamin D3 receptor [Intoshia linei]|uniref:1,25-dihydroxyvitamin D3 receptor n=1 Tax=Intoshia linei TaxID=1819745 RepID=A0A177B4S2_9BILA|nr:1,25-dihydroxyvitamin D3 receptor [Intoshia linei]